MPTHCRSPRKLILILLLLLLPVALIGIYVGAYFVLSHVSLPAQSNHVPIRVFSNGTLVTVFRPLNRLESQVWVTTEIGWADETSNVIRSE
jgi:hypothetical protein